MNDCANNDKCDCQENGGSVKVGCYDPAKYTQAQLDEALKKHKFKDHEIAIFVNNLNNISRIFGQTDMLRDRLSRCVNDFLTAK